MSKRIDKTVSWFHKTAHYQVKVIKQKGEALLIMRTHPNGLLPYEATNVKDFRASFEPDRHYKPQNQGHEIENKRPHPLLCATG